MNVYAATITVIAKIFPVFLGQRYHEIKKKLYLDVSGYQESSALNNHVSHIFAL